MGLGVPGSVHFCSCSLIRNVYWVMRGRVQGVWPGRWLGLGRVAGVCRPAAVPWLAGD